MSSLDDKGASCRRALRQLRGHTLLPSPGLLGPGLRSRQAAELVLDALDRTLSAQRTARAFLAARCGGFRVANVERQTGLPVVHTTQHRFDANQPVVAAWPVRACATPWVRLRPFHQTCPNGVQLDVPNGDHQIRFVHHKGRETPRPMVRHQAPGPHAHIKPLGPYVPCRCLIPMSRPKYTMMLSRNRTTIVGPNRIYSHP
mgnify:CR=1 FL=1